MPSLLIRWRRCSDEDPESSRIRPIHNSISLLKGGQDMASLHFLQGGNFQAHEAAS
jgi:hypothetical protein